jgi:hypothetical protein
MYFNPSWWIINNRFHAIRPLIQVALLHVGNGKISGVAIPKLI